MLLYRVFIKILLLFICNSVLADVSVHGYFRKDGSYVKPHMRSNPDGNFYNNWSTFGNINPYTGREGTKIIPSRSTVNKDQLSSDSYSTFGNGVKSNFSSNSNSVPRNNSSSTTILFNRIYWYLMSANINDATYIGLTNKVYDIDGLPVVAVMYTGVIKDNDHPTWLGRRFFKVKVNCYNNKIAVIADAVVNSKGIIVKNEVYKDQNQLNWFLVSKVFNQNNFYRISKICM